MVDSFSVLRQVQALVVPEDAKTNLAAVRLVHFLCLAYLVLGCVTPFAHRLNQGLGSPIVRIGQQSLATFVMSIAAAEIGGFLLQLFGTGFLATLGVNFFGFSVLLGTAWMMAFVKREPWSKSYAKRDIAIPVHALKK